MPNPPTAPTLIVVDDDELQRVGIAAYLRREGFDVREADGGAALFEHLRAAPADAVLLDVRMPGDDGFVLARRMREQWPALGIVMVTARHDAVDRIVGLETGADDYVVKPFDPRELLARIKSVLRRLTQARGPQQDALAPAGHTPAPPARGIPMGRWVLDLEAHVLRAADGSTEPLTATEFDLLRVFASHPDRPLSRDWLLQVTSHRDADPFDRSIDLRITRLRRKLERDPQKPSVLRTVRGVGYLFDSRARDAGAADA